MGTVHRRKRERNQRIAQIKEAALSVFSEKGYEAATMDEIAERAELSKGILYYYFPSKRELYRSLVLDFTSRFYGEAYQKVKDEEDFREAIYALLDFHIQYFRSRLDELSIILKEDFLGSEDENFRRDLARFRAPLERKINEISPAPWLFDLFWTYILGLSVKMIQGKDAEDLGKEAQAFKKMLKGELP